MGRSSGNIVPNDELQTQGKGENGGTHMHLENLHIHAVDAKSFQELTAKNPGAIVSPFLRALQQGGQVRNAIKGAM